MAWARIDCDLHELVVTHMGRVLAPARTISRELRQLADATGLCVLAVELDRAFGLADPMATARWMADDLTTPSRVGWAAALSRWSRRGRLPATPSPGSWALYLDTLGSGRFPDFRPTEDDPALWDLHPYVGAPKNTRVVAIVGDGESLATVTRAMCVAGPSISWISYSVAWQPSNPGKLVAHLSVNDPRIGDWAETGVTVVVTVRVDGLLSDALGQVAAMAVPATSIVLAGYPMPWFKPGGSSTRESARPTSTVCRFPQ